MRQEKETGSGQFFDTVNNPALKYFGFALLLGWHYSLWFVPRVFVFTNLLADVVTVCWLICLGSSALALFLIPVLLGRKRHLSDFRWLYWASPATACAGSLFLTLFPFCLEIPFLAYGIATLIGVSGATQWILWGDHYACVKANFSITHIGPMVGLALLASVGIASILPSILSSVFVGVLPVVSGLLLIRASRDDTATDFPRLLPKSASKEGFRGIFVVCLISCVAAAACYYLVAIIPWNLLPTSDASFTFGIAGGGLLMLAIASVCLISKNKYNIFKMFPWLIIFLVVAFALFLASTELFFSSFVLALAISSVFEVLLVMYFGILTSKGYVSPAFAFGLSGGAIRGGIALGNTLAIAYEFYFAFEDPIVVDTILVFICILVVLIIPLVRQEYTIKTLTCAPPEESSLDKTCREVAAEFGLSARETEILTLIAHGYTTERIANKLVISPYTVNTHIRHTYDKMQIHKRSELLNYINMQRSDY